MKQSREGPETSVQPGLPMISGFATQQTSHAMKTFAITLAALLAASAGSADVLAADDPQLQRLALCQDTWLDWKGDAKRMAQLVKYLETQFDRNSDAAAAFTPKSPTSVLGWPVTQVYPQSVGMGVGFSMIVEADHARIRTGIEQQIGKPLTCKNSDGIRACEVELGAKTTAVLLTDQHGRAKSSLVGCYYFYEK